MPPHHRPRAERKEREGLGVGSTFFCPLPPFTSETSPFQQLSIAAEGTRREQLGTETENLQTGGLAHTK